MVHNGIEYADMQLISEAYFLLRHLLGMDPGAIADVFDEADPAVKALIRRAIDGAHAKGIPVGICGQAPSDYPEVAQFLVKHGIDSVSLTPDSVLRTMAAMLEIEREQGRASRSRAAE